VIQKRLLVKAREKQEGAAAMEIPLYRRA